MVPKCVFAWQICSNITHFKQQQEILPAHLNFFENGLKKVFFHRRLRSNITHLAQHVENLPIPLICFAKKQSSPEGDSGLLLKSFFEIFAISEKFSLVYTVHTTNPDL